MTGAKDAVELARLLNAARVTPVAVRQVASVVRTAGASAVLDLGDAILTRADGSRLLARAISTRQDAGEDDAQIRDWLRTVAQMQQAVGQDAAPVRDVEPE